VNSLVSSSNERLGSSYSIGRGSASGQYSVVDNESGKVVSYQDSLQDAEEMVRDSVEREQWLNDNWVQMCHQFMEAKDRGYDGSISEWVDDAYLYKDLAVVNSGLITSSSEPQPYVVIFKDDEGKLGWVKVDASTVSEARKLGREHGSIQMVLTLQGIKDILNGDVDEYLTVNEAVFDFVRGIHFSRKAIKSDVLITPKLRDKAPVFKNILFNKGIFCVLVNEWQYPDVQGMPSGYDAYGRGGWDKRNNSLWLDGGSSGSSSGHPAFIYDNFYWAVNYQKKFSYEGNSYPGVVYISGKNIHSEDHVKKDVVLILKGIYGKLPANGTSAFREFKKALAGVSSSHSAIASYGHEKKVGNLIASSVVPASVDVLGKYEKNDPELESLLNTPVKDIPRYQYLVIEDMFKSSGKEDTLHFLIEKSLADAGLHSFFSLAGNKPVGFFSYRKSEEEIYDIKTLTFLNEKISNGVLAKDLFSLVFDNISRYSIRWRARKDNPANRNYEKVRKAFNGSVRSLEEDPQVLEYLLPVRGIHSQIQSHNEVSTVSPRKNSFILPGFGYSECQYGVGKLASGVDNRFTERAGLEAAKDFQLGPGFVGREGAFGLIDFGSYEAELIESATVQELLDANNSPNFYHRADHLKATKAVGAPELVRSYANSTEYRVKSEHFKENKTYYRVWVLFKDFKVLARDKKIDLEDAVDYALNFCDIHVSCTCPSFLFHGFRYMGDQLDYLYGLPREKRFPKIRNPTLQNASCKHVHLVLEQLKKDQEKIIKMFLEYYKRLPSTPPNQMIAIPAPKPQQLADAPAVEENEEGDIEVSLDETETQVEAEPEVISTEDPSNPDAVYVDTKMAENSLPEDQRYKYADDDDAEGVSDNEDYGEAAIPVGDSVSTEDVMDLEHEIEEADTKPKNDNERFVTDWSFSRFRRL
jgi:hypothetical protein